MATSTISNTVKDSSGNAVPGVAVLIDAVPGPAYRISDGSELAAPTSLVTDASGIWTATLERSANIDPPGTYYRVREYIPKTKGGTKIWFFTVPATNGLLHDNLVTPTLAQSIVKPTVVTSSTRPTSPYVGQMIFESDTGKVLFYYGSTLGWQPAWNGPWGEIAASSQTSSATTTSTSYVDAFSQTFTAVNGRRYDVSFTALASLTGGASNPLTNIAICDGSNTVLAEHAIGFVGATQFTDSAVVMHRSAGNESGSVTRKIRIKVSVGTGTVGYNASSTNPAILQIIDVGPAANPVIT